MIMSSLYSILEIPSNAVQEQIEGAYLMKIKNPNLGVDDYENIHELIEVRKSHQILSNKAYRFLYDVKHGYYEQNRYPVSFDNQADVISFLSIISEQILSLKQQNITLTNHNSAINGLKKEKIKSEKKLAEEKDRSLEMENTISDLLDKIAQLISDNESKTSELTENNNRLSVLEKQNGVLRVRLRRNKIETFKIVCFVSAIVGLITYFLAINF